MSDSSAKNLPVRPTTMPTPHSAARAPGAVRLAVRPWLTLIALASCLVGWLAGTSLAQPSVNTVVYTSSVGGTIYLDATSLARALGDVANAMTGVLTWQGEQGVVTFFAGSADALLQSPGNAGPDDWALSAPVLEGVAAFMSLPQGGPGEGSARSPLAGWALPLDAVQLLGVAYEETPEGGVLHSASGVHRLRQVAATELSGADAAQAASVGAVGEGWEATTVNGVPAVRFYAEPDKSLLLLDLDLAPLAFPEATAVVDDAVAMAGNDHALLVVVTALSPQAWSSSLTFEQDGQSLETRHPYRLRVYQGDPEQVAPGASVAAVVLLPPSFSLYRPLTVTWEAVRATVTFRR